MRWLTMIAVCLLPTLAGATTHIIDGASDLPYTTSGTYDTVSVTINGILSAVSGTSITLAHDHSVLRLNGNTLYVCHQPVSGFNYGIQVSADSCSIMNGTLEQYSTSTNDSCAIINVGSGVRKLTVTNVNVHPRGYSSGGIRAPGASEVWINGGNWTSYVTDFDSREYQWTAPILLQDEVDGSRTAPQRFRYWVSHVTIDSCPHAGIVMNGGTLWCDSNFVRVDARNHWTYPSGDIFRGTANAYGIAIDRIGANCRVYGNTVRSGKNYRGGRGIALDGQASYLTHRSIEVAYNDDSTHAGPDANYGGEYQSVGVRIRDTGTDSLYFHHNTIVVVADTASATTHTGPGCIAVWLSNNGIFWRFEYNTIKAVGVTPCGERGAGSSYGGFFARAVAFDEMTISDSTVWRYNRIESNVAPINFGEVNTTSIAGENCHFYCDTINRLTPNYSDEWGNDGAIVMSLGSGDCENNSFTDVVFPNDSTIYWDGSGPGEALIKRLFKITVLGNDGIPFEGARVRIRNAYGVSTVVGTTDLYGRVADFPAAIRYFHVGVGSDSTYSPFTVSAIFGTDSVAIIETGVGLRTNLTDTLRLNSGGTGELDTIPPGTVGDLSVLPGSVSGHFTFSWTSTGDDGTSGAAAYDSIRYATAPLNASTWATAVKVARPDAPMESGETDQIDLAETAPKAGQFYYVGIKAYDDAGHVSALAVDSGFAKGVEAPEITTGLTDIDTTAQEITFYCAEVRSYLDLVYQFQTSAKSTFSSPTTIEGTVQGGYTLATFDLPAEDDTIYVRCRATASDASETSAWSTARAFSISGEAVNAPPDVPVAFSPLPADTMTSLTVALMLANSEDLDGDPLTYQFELYNAAGTTRLAYSGAVAEGATNTSWTVTSGVIQDQTTYRWTARSYDGQAYSDWMDQVSFTVIKLTADEIAAAFVHAFPNPVHFADGDQATFVVGEEPVDLTIMTVSGDIVLRKENLEGEFVWDGTNQSGTPVSVGLYLWFLSDDRGQGKLIVQP